MHASPVSTTPKQTIKSTATLKSSTTTTRRSSNSSVTNASAGAAPVSPSTPKGHLAGSTVSSSGSTTSKSKAPTTSAKTAQPSSGTMNNKTAAAASNNSHEIEEISKKISEHADAIYRTWKSRGLAPTELLEFYTNAAAATVGVAVDGVGGGGGGGVDVGVGPGTRVGGDFFATSADVKTTEGLQQLVNTFVIKDKEQRGVKVGSGGGASTKKTTAASGSVAKAAAKEEPVRIAQNTLNLKGAKALHGNAHDDAIDGGDVMARVTGKKLTTTTSSKSAISPEPSAGRTASVLKSVSNFEKGQTAPVATAAASPAKEKPLSLYERKLREQQAGAGVGAGVSAGVEPKKTPKTAKVSVASPAATPTATPTPPPTSNFDFDLHLTDVNDLSQLQTKNLQKIKELLQQEGHSLAGKPTTTTTTVTATKKKPQTNGIKLLEAGATTPTTTTPIATPSATATPSRTATSKAFANESGPAATTTTRKTVKKSSNSATKSTKSDNKSDDVAAVGIVTNSNSSTATTTATATNKVTKKSSKSNNVAGAAGRTSPTASLASPTATAARPLSKSPSPLPSGGDDDDVDGGGGVGAGGSMIDTGAFVVIDVVDEATKLATLAAPTATAAARIKGNGGADKNSEPKRAAIQVAKLQQDTSRTSYQQHPQQPQQQHDQQQETIKIIQKITTKTPGAPKTSPKPSAPSSAGNVVKFSVESSASPVARPEGSEAALVDPTPVMEVARTTMPTPTKLKSSRSSLTNGQDKNLGRPILTRGSVAERVMMFEKCPDARNSFLNIKRPDPADAPPKSLAKVKLHATPPPPVDHTSLQREIRSTKSVYIPRFYFPHGKPQPQIALERTLRGILSAFDSFPNNQVTKDELPQILKLCGIPFYWRMPVMVFCQQGGSGLVERQRFVEFWKQMNVYCHDAASRFVYILSRGQRYRSYILPEDLAPMVQDVVDTHPGLAFLKEATEFHSRYVHTVIARIFYSVNRSWSGRISIAELKKSDLLEIITMLEEEDDINQIMAFFSYEHFYVIYCKFWELDKDHDLLINQEDLAAHSDHALSTRIVERIFSGCVTRSDNKKHEDDEPKMSYTDFVWFLLSEEDKRTPTAIEYWFRCMDVDGDGVLSMYELEYFYEEQQQRMESIGIETLPFEDCLCQMLDMIKPQRRDCVTLGDLKRCRMTHVFFDTFFNLEKYLDHEQRDPFATQRDEYASDWDRFAAQEYELLITEEND